MKIGDPVVFIDAVKKEHPAILTNIFGEIRIVQQMQDGNLVDVKSIPCANLVWVSSDESKQDSYGRQLERATSCVHISSNSAGAYCWKFPDE